LLWSKKGEGKTATAVFFGIKWVFVSHECEVGYFSGANFGFGKYSSGGNANSGEPNLRRVNLEVLILIPEISNSRVVNSRVRFYAIFFSWFLHVRRVVLRMVVWIPVLAVLLIAPSCQDPDSFFVVSQTKRSAETSFSRIVSDQRFELASSFVAGGNVEAAIRMYEGLAKDHLDDPLPYLELGRLFLDMQAVDEAEQSYIAAANRGAVTEGRIGRGHVFLARNNGRLAIEMFYPIFVLDSTSVEVINGLGVAHDLLGNHVKAQRFYLAALQKKSNWRPALNNLGLSLALSGNYIESINIFQRLNTSPQATARDRQNLALALMLSGHVSESEKISLLDMNLSQALANTEFVISHVHRMPNNK
jgi:Tfp pilus assembly protein PilF